MTSIRHNPGPEDSLLDAARHCILAVGWKRTTLTDVARRAGVSRMTLYRRWPDMQTLLSDLMTREWLGVVEPAPLGEGATRLDRLASWVAATAAGMRDNDLFRKIVAVDPELLLPYLLDRRGRTQDSVLALLESAIVEGQAEGSMREGDPALLARAVVLSAHGFALSAQTMTPTSTPAMTPTSTPAMTQTGDALTVADLDGELHQLVKRYLAP